VAVGTGIGVDVGHGVYVGPTLGVDHGVNVGYGVYVGQGV
jgi:hypothetical protein